MPSKKSEKEEKKEGQQTSKKSKPVSKSKSVKSKTVKDSTKTSSKSKSVKPKQSKRTKTTKDSATSKKNKGVSGRGKSARSISSKTSSKLSSRTNKSTKKDKIDTAEDTQPEKKVKEKKKKVKELRETLIQVITAYDEAAMEITGSKAPPKLDKGIQFDDKKHNEICELAARQLGQEPRSYKDYFLVVLLPDQIWDEIEKAEVDLSITKLKELAKAYNRNEIDSAKVIELFKEIIEKNLTTAAVKEKIKSLT